MTLTPVALDADFIQKIAAYRDTAPTVLFDKLMADLGCSPLVHPFVFEHELFACPLAKELARTAQLRVVPYNEFITSDTRKQMYRATFYDAYRLLTFERFGRSLQPPTDIFSHCAENDYGEIHTVLMAAELGIPVFYSNDHSAKTLCDRFSNGLVQSYTMEDACEMIAALESKQTTSKERKYLKHRDNNEHTR